jgi:ABC-2 type transport system permease protein
MTTTTSTVAQDRYGLTHVVRSEWTKFISLRSSRWTLTAFPVTAIALGVLIAAVSGAGWPQMSEEARASWDPTNNVLAGLIPGYLIIPTLGVLMMTSEYSSGGITSTLAAVPRRPLVLIAKAMVLATVAFAACEAVTFATFGISQRVMGSAPPATLSQPGVLRALVLSGAYLVLLGLLGLGLGTVIRSSGGAIAAYAATALVAPMILAAAPGELGRFAPMVILANSIAAADVQPGYLSPGAGFAVMAGYSALAMTAGLIVLVRRDA